MIKGVSFEIHYSLFDIGYSIQAINYSLNIFKSARDSHPLIFYAYFKNIKSNGFHSDKQQVFVFFEDP